jgi:hypothetical protein
MKLFMIGKAENPRCLPKNKDNLLVKYHSQENAYMTTSLCSRWFNDVFLREVQHKLDNNEKIALLMDNCACHNIVNNNSDINILYLPENLTALLQPLDRGIIFQVKARYKELLAKQYVFALNNWEQMSAKASRMVPGTAGVKEGRLANTKDIIDIANQSWTETKMETIGRCWVSANILPGHYKEELSAKYPKKQGKKTEEDIFPESLVQQIKQLRIPEQVQRTAMPELCQDLEENIPLSDNDIYQWIVDDSDEN